LIPTYRHLPFWKHRYPKVKARLQERIDQGAIIYPRPKQLFAALRTTKFQDVKVVILAQDPYHTKGLAHGYAFSVLPHIKKLPASLRNIQTEYCSDLGYPKPKTGDLRPWAERGVLLLNTCLTVEEGRPNSHEDFGWDMLTFDILRALDSRGGVVFNLWGRQAQHFKGCISASPTICVPHPSGLSSYTGWFGSKVFSRSNQELAKCGVSPIDWRLI
jgi:uracil-DNA glycosylase